MALLHGNKGGKSQRLLIIPGGGGMYTLIHPPCIQKEVKLLHIMRYAHRKPEVI